MKGKFYDYPGNQMKNVFIILLLEVPYPLRALALHLQYVCVPCWFMTRLVKKILITRKLVNFGNCSLPD